MTIQTKIYRLSAVCGVFTALSLIIPRFVSNPEGGFAAGATAVLVFLAMLLLATLVSIYLVAITLKAYQNIQIPAKIAGIAPALLLSSSLFGLIVFLRF